MSELTTWPTKNKPLDKCGTAKRFFHFFILLNLLGINGAHIKITMCKTTVTVTFLILFRLTFLSHPLGSH
jgi:hypothetical protein